MDFSNKVVVITGAGQGIGACTAVEFAKRKANVIIVEQDEEAGHEVEALIQEQGLDALFIKTDVSEEQSVKEMAFKVAERYGKIDILVNNAAIQTSGNLFTTTIEDFEKVLRVNVTGAYMCTKYCVPYMMSEGASIVNIASTRAMMSEPNTEPYSASKGALLALTHSLAASLGPKIRVNAISPGWIETNGWKKKKDRKFVALREKDHVQHLTGRVGVPEDVAQAILYLTNEAAGFITGANFVIDGGMTV
ncbi:MAG: SDR family oxidoreductase, partial [Niameybacter sp.]